MRKDFILTPEERQLKRQRLEENRRLSSGVKNHSNSTKSEKLVESTTTNQNIPLVRYKLTVV